MNDFAVPLSVFLQISSVTFTFGILAFLAKTIPAVKSKINELTSNRAHDTESGAIHLLSKELRKIISFNDRFWLFALGFSMLFTFLANSIYLLGLQLPALSDAEWYGRTCAILTWIGLLPSLAAAICSFRLYMHFVSVLSFKES